MPFVVSAALCSRVLRLQPSSFRSPKAHDRKSGAVVGVKRKENNNVRSKGRLYESGSILCFCAIHDQSAVRCSISVLNEVLARGLLLPSFYRKFTLLHTNYLFQPKAAAPCPSKLSAVIRGCMATVVRVSSRCLFNLHFCRVKFVLQPILENPVANMIPGL